MGKLSELVAKEKSDRLHAMRNQNDLQDPKEHPRMFKSEDFTGFGDFLSENPGDMEQRNEARLSKKSQSFFTIIKMLMSMFDD